ncbi:MAG TPA: NaeI family type II restriction endonuclease [Solirubrobacterales bacterium]|nr:NaeI family type II restriction endonuclease [Solirubrobacterales bacterium]
MLSATSKKAPDDAWIVVESKLRALGGPDPVKKFGQAVRQAIDEVLDGPRTGRCRLTELAKTEKTYVGTKVEIVVRTSLGLDRGPILDLEIEGHPVDIKWAMNSVWQIPMEAVGQLCLCIGGLDEVSRFQVGLIRCDEEWLNLGENRDRKRTISAVGRSKMSLLVPSSPLPINFVEQMDHALRIAVMGEPTIQARVTRLFTLLPRTPIPRNAIATVARTTGDPLRRVRADTWAGNPLGDMKILSAKYGNPIVVALGYRPLERDEFMSVPQIEINALPHSKKQALPATTRRLFEFD